MNKKPELDEIDRLLEKWGQQLPEPSAQTVKNTLDSLRAVTKLTPRFNWLRLGVLGGMAAACVLVVVGLAVLLNLAGKPAPSPVQVAVAPTVTSGVEVSPSATSEMPPFTPTAAVSPAVSTMSPVVLQNEPTATPASTNPAVSPPTETTAAASGSASTSTPAPVIALPPTVEVSPVQVPPRPSDISKPNPPVPAKSPTSGGPGIPPPPTVPPTPTAAPPAPASPAPPTPLPETVTTLSGQVATVDGSGFTLSNGQPRISFGPNTRLLSNGAAIALSNLKAGQIVTVQARKTAQGQLVAETITLTSKVIGPPGNPPKPPTE